MEAELAPVLIGSGWRPAQSVGRFRALDPSTGEAVGAIFPISAAADLEAALAAATDAAPQLAALAPEAIADFLDAHAAGIEAAAAELVAIASLETALPAATRLADNELPRTTRQLRLAAAAVRARSWTQPVIDTAAGLRSALGPLGKPVAVFGPNNFPLAFHALAGSDFASAIAARNPVIGKAHPSHPGTSRLLGDIALRAARQAGLPEGSVQMLYHFAPETGLEFCADRRLGAIGFTGSRTAGLALKAAADRAGIPFFAELSAVNPVFLLPGALAERGAALARDYFASCTLGSGQFCTNPGLLIVPCGANGDAFVQAAAAQFDAAAPAMVFSESVLVGLETSVATLRAAGAGVLAGKARREAPGLRFAPSLLGVDAETFLRDPTALQTEAFGPVGLIVRAADETAMLAIVEVLEGSLTGSIHAGAADAAFAARLASRLRPRVGRLIADRMPTGVAVSAAMNHGGPYPSTSAAGFTAVGMPGAIRRFAALHGYDHVPDAWLPEELRDTNPQRVWRIVDGVPTCAGLEHE